MRFTLFFALTLFAGLFVLQGGVHAQTSLRDYQELNDLNKRSPLQNIEFQKSKDVLGSRVLDNKKKVVGHVSDAILNTNGGISSLTIRFDRLRLNEPVPFNIRENRVDADSKGFVLSIDDDAITDLYPVLLNDIQTASGAELDNKSVNLSRLMGAQLRNESNDRLGVVTDVLFKGQGTRAEALHIKLTYRTLNNETLAIPFRNVRFDNQTKRSIVIVNDSFGQSILEFAEKKR